MGTCLICDALSGIALICDDCYVEIDAQLVAIRASGGKTYSVAEVAYELDIEL